MQVVRKLFYYMIPLHSRKVGSMWESFGSDVDRYYWGSSCKLPGLNQSSQHRKIHELVWIVNLKLFRNVLNHPCLYISQRIFQDTICEWYHMISWYHVRQVKHLYARAMVRPSPIWPMSGLQIWESARIPWEKLPTNFPLSPQRSDGRHGPEKYCGVPCSECFQSPSDSSILLRSGCLQLTRL